MDFPLVRDFGDVESSKFETEPCLDMEVAHAILMFYRNRMNVGKTTIHHPWLGMVYIYHL